MSQHFNVFLLLDYTGPESKLKSQSVYSFVCSLPLFEKLNSTLQTSTEAKLAPRYRFVHVQVLRGWNKEHLYSSITVPSIMCAPQVLR